jgi:PPOX class probable F420-dependent enzyme
MPVANRPHMPGYGILPPGEGPGLLPWSWAAERLASSHNYWLATTTPEGRPHVMAVWGIWHGDALYFSTARDSRKARNLARNPHCVVCTENAKEAVIVEGQASLVTDSAIMTELPQAYLAKYGEGLPADASVYQVQPQVVFGFIEEGEQFAGTATRWRFS